ncbi:MAG: vWA domain-containing protein [Bacteroidia bacterium]
MKLIVMSFVLSIFFSVSGFSQTPVVNTPPASLVVLPQPRIDLVFCLDATGSMSGLISTAKEKIWDIATSLTQTTPAPEIRIGMIFYRDRGDAFVTKVYPLTSDVDSVYAELLNIRAQGGGDSPESVNQALHEAVAQMSWGTGSNIYKTIFLVGDCPPHMDYKDDVKYTETCKLAAEKDIIMNTIKLGISCSDAVKHFQTIASLTNGNYQSLGQNADDVIIKTPYDDSINYYSFLIDSTKIYYGSYEVQSRMNYKKEKSLEIQKNASSNSKASRTAYNYSKSGEKNLYGSNELINDLMNQRVNLDSIKTADLPEAMKKMTPAERKAYTEKLMQQRKTAQENINRLNVLRQNYVRAEKEKSKNATTSSFSDSIFEVMQKQAAAKGVTLSR